MNCSVLQKYALSIFYGMLVMYVGFLFCAQPEQKIADLDQDLIEAIKTGEVPVVKALLDNGANPNAKSQQKKYKAGETALIIAISLDHIEIVKLLVNYGADINLIGRPTSTPLIIAAKEGNINIVKFLLEHGVDIHKKNAIKETALKFAEENGHTEIVGLLKKAGAKE